jgi:TolB-like protein/DNA-binding winged helix-turn-helix (wHTH) protein/Tfp pilus assembly protein PilF
MRQTCIVHRMNDAAILFGPFRLEPAAGRLLRDGAQIALGNRALVLLAALAEAKGQTVSKADLMERVWPGQIVEEGNLTVQIAALRRAMGTDSEGRDWILTVPREGYRLIGGSAAAPFLPPVPVLPSIAVLPFQNLSADTEQEYFADGIAEDIIAALSRFKNFAVISRNSSFAHKGRAADARQTAGALGAAYVLEGSVRRAGDRLRVTAQLFDGVSGAQLWAQNFDGAAEDIFDFQDRITASAAAIAEPKTLQAEIDRSRRDRPGSLDAYDFYLRALQKLSTYRAEDNADALELLEKSIALEPGFAPALANAVYGYEHRVTMGWPQVGKDDGARAMELTRAALAAAKDDAIVLAHCGFAILAIERDFEKGLYLAKRSVELNPNDVLVLFKAGAAHIWCGSLDEAQRLFKRVIELSPGDTVNAFAGLAHVNLALGHYQEALEWAGRSYAENPNFDVIHWLLIAANAHLGRMDEAKRWLRALQALSPGVTMVGIQSGHTQKEPGRMAAIFDGLRMAGMPERPADTPVLPSLAVLPFTNLGGDPAQDYFADGIVEDIITALSRFKSFAVIARNSSFVYKGRAVDVRQVAEELAVRYVLEGSIRRSGSALRISAQLIDAARGIQLWAKKYEGALEDIFAFQDRITECVVPIVEPQIQSAEIERSRRERPGSVAAYDLYLQTLSGFLNESADENANSYAKISQALAIEPDNARYLAHAAFLLMARNAGGYPPVGGDDIGKCAELARRGIEHAAGDGTVMASCGFALIQTAKEYEYGMAVLRSALEINPNSFMVVCEMGVACIHCGDIQEALTFLHRAMTLSPGDPSASLSLTGIAHAHMALGDYEEALRWANRSRALSVDFDPTYWLLIAANAQLGRMDEARRCLKEFQKHAPGITIAGIRAGQPAKDPSRVAAILEGLRMAGMPES